jgi:hypothetical protein
MPPEELEDVLERLDALAVRLGELPCLPPESDEAFRRLDNVPEGDENAQASHTYSKQLCEMVKRRGSL